MFQINSIQGKRWMSHQLNIVAGDKIKEMKKKKHREMEKT